MMNISCSTFLQHQAANNVWNYKEKLTIIKVQQLCLSMRRGEMRRVYVYFKYVDTFTLRLTHSVQSVVTVQFNTTLTTQQPTVFPWEIKLKLRR